MGIRLACSTIGFRDRLHASAQNSRNQLRGYLEMPRLGRARRKTRPSLCGHSVGSLTRFLHELWLLSVCA